ncbi:hypothetical protein AltMyV_sSgp1 [Alternaria alternata virus 1]|uniref:Uncharacterized protein n=1 Tax=Alternaria alternata virus 1 TaxID=483537 RepID=B3IXK4_9VIRU|nr:hypothetical protein AltMyV_sSgp1 [Alternaria alternata virus 1]BAG49051.1 hypothetical protein [Alternaria alternata virus 1]
MFDSFCSFPAFVPFVLDDFSGRVSAPALLTVQATGGMKDGRQMATASIAFSGAVPSVDALDDDTLSCGVGRYIHHVHVDKVSFCGGAVCDKETCCSGCGVSSVRPDPEGGFFSSASLGALVSAGLVEAGLEDERCTVMVSFGGLRIPLDATGGVVPHSRALDEAALGVFLPPPQTSDPGDVAVPNEPCDEEIKTLADGLLSHAVELGMPEQAAEASVVVPLPPPPPDPEDLPGSAMNLGTLGGVLAAIADGSLVREIKTYDPPAGGFEGPRSEVLERRLQWLNALGSLSDSCYSVVADAGWYRLLLPFAHWQKQLGLLSGREMDLLLGGLSRVKDPRLRADRYLHFLRTVVGASAGGVGDPPWAYGSVANFQVGMYRLLWPARGAKVGVGTSA